MCHLWVCVAAGTLLGWCVQWWWSVCVCDVGRSWCGRASCSHMMRHSHHERNTHHVRETHTQSHNQPTRPSSASSSSSSSCTFWSVECLTAIRCIYIYITLNSSQPNLHCIFLLIFKKNFLKNYLCIWQTQFFKATLHSKLTMISIPCESKPWSLHFFIYVFITIFCKFHLFIWIHYFINCIFIFIIYLTIYMSEYSMLESNCS